MRGWNVLQSTPASPPVRAVARALADITADMDHRERSTRRHRVARATERVTFPSRSVGGCDQRLLQFGKGAVCVVGLGSAWAGFQRWLSGAARARCRA